MTPMQLTIALGPRAAVEPERPARAPRGGGSRTGSSPRPRWSSDRSCARGARSRWPAARRPRRTARPRARRRGRGRRAAARRAPRRAPAARRRAPGAGARLTRRMPSSWWFSTSGQHATSPSSPRTASTDSSRSNGTSDSRISATSPPPSSDHAASRSSAEWRTRLSLAVVPTAPGLEHRGEATHGLDRERRDPARSSTAAKAGVPMPRRRNVSFSVRRSCATSSDRAPGRTGRPRATRKRAASAGTPSHS